RILRLVCAAVLSSAAAWAPNERMPIRLDVDLRDAPRKIFHAVMHIPVSPGPLTLVYPKWIQGEHAPTGPITDLVGIRIFAGNKAVEWKRDSVELFAFHMTVPGG